MDMTINCEDPKINKYVEMITTSILKQLKLESSKKHLMISVEETMDETGLTIPYGKDVIFVALNVNQTLFQLTVTLAHELVHVKQYAKGLLKPGIRGTIKWRGKSYPKKTPYLDRPWELQAFAQQEILTRRALET